MADHPAPEFKPGATLDEITVAYRSAAAAGTAPTKEQLCAHYPALADELCKFLAGQETLEALTASASSEGALISAAGMKERSFGDYVLLEAIARGGMGVVYRARQVSLNRIVALKMILAGEFASEEEVLRFHREAEAAAHLDHAHIVPIYEVGTQRGQHYFSMKLVEGGSLAQWIARCRSQIGDFGRNQHRDVAALVATVARAVHHAHQRGILHRDLKPGNILLQADKSAPEGKGRGLQGVIPFVSDFGLAKRVQGDLHETRTGRIVGTPAYMPPEQARPDKALTTAVDVYGLGAILYELLTGRPPFRAATPLETLMQVLEREPERPRKLNPRVDLDLETICLKCLDKDPALRYDSAAALAADLDQWLAGEPIAARPIAAPARLWRWCRRNPGLTVASGTALAALVLAAVISTVFAFYQHGNAIRSAQDAEDLRQEQARKQTALAEANAQKIRAQNALADATAQKARADERTRLAEFRLAESYLNRGLGLCEQGDVGRGLLLLAHSLKSVPAGEQELDSAARANLAFWRQGVAGLQQVLEHKSEVNCVAFSPDNKYVLTGCQYPGPAAQVWEVSSGQPVGPALPHHTVSCVSFSPDGKYVLTGSRQNTARVWEALSGRPVGLELTHKNAVWSVAFSPDGNYVLTGSWDSTAQVWETLGGRPVGPRLQHRGPVVCVTFSPDGKHVLTGSVDHRARVWETISGKQVGPELTHQDEVSSVAFSPDGKYVLTGSLDKSARLWEMASGNQVGPVLPHRGAVHRVAFCPDGKYVLTGSYDSTAQVWETASGRPVGKALQHRGPVNGVAFSPNGKYVLTGSADNTARLWETATGARVGAELEHRSAVTSLAFSPSGKYVLTGSRDNTVRLWEIPGGEPIDPVLPHRESVRSVAFGPDAKYALTASWDGTARLWDTTDGKPFGKEMQHGERIESAAFSRDGKYLLTTGRSSVRIWQTADGKPMGRELGRGGLVGCAAFSPDGKYVLVGWYRKPGKSFASAAQLWEIASGNPAGPELLHNFEVNSVAFSPDGIYVLTGSRSTAQLWEPFGAKPIGPPLRHEFVVWSVAFSPDGKYMLTGSLDHTAQVWDTASGQRVGPPLKHGDMVRCAIFSPDGKYVLTGSEDFTARLWERDSGRQVGPPLDHRGFVYSVAFSPDGKYALTGSWDHTARLWLTATGKPVGPALQHRAEVLSVAFSPGGKQVLTGSGDSTGRLWHLPAPWSGDPERIARSISILTGMEVDESGSVRLLDPQTWRQRRE
jgi:eukaryotic-like serine/threonine-protein kinase